MNLTSSLDGETIDLYLYMNACSCVIVSFVLTLMMRSRRTLCVVVSLHVLCFLASASKLFNNNFLDSDVALWIDKIQMLQLNGIPMDLYIILDGHVLPYIIQTNFEKYLPLIPFNVDHVNLTWKAGKHKVHYDFNLYSINKTLLDHPSISIATKGWIPRKPTIFTLFLSCSGNEEKSAIFTFQLLLHNHRGRILPGMPIKLNMQKQCRYSGLCQDGCLNGGLCMNGVCACFRGFYGPRCQFSFYRCTDKISCYQEKIKNYAIEKTNVNIT